MAHTRIGKQNLSYQVPSLLRDFAIGGPLVLIITNALVDGLDFFRLEGWLSNDEGVEDDSY
jgi:hypothetical protein